MKHLHKFQIYLTYTNIIIQFTSIIIIIKYYYIHQNEQQQQQQEHQTPNNFNLRTTFNSFYYFLLSTLIRVKSESALNTHSSLLSIDSSIDHNRPTLFI